METATKEYVPKTFALLSNGTVFSDFARLTTEGKQVFDELNETRLLPLRSVILINGKRTVLRYLSECGTTINQDEQIKLGFAKAGDPNEFSRQSRDDNQITNGFISSKNDIHLEYLEKTGFNRDIAEGYSRVLEFGEYYKEYKPQIAVKENNEFTRLQAKALTRFDELSDEDKQTVLLKINGSFYQFSDDKEDWYTDITSIVNSSTQVDRKNIDLILNFAESKKTAVTDVSVIIGRGIDKKILSFTEDTESIMSKSKVSDKWVKVLSVTPTLPLESKLSLFTDYLQTKDGETVLNNIKAALKI